MFHADRRTDMTKLIVFFFSQFCERTQNLLIPLSGFQQFEESTGHSNSPWPCLTSRGYSLLLTTKAYRPSQGSQRGICGRKSGTGIIFFSSSPVRLSVCCFLSTMCFPLSLELLGQIPTGPLTGKPGFIACHLFLTETVSYIDCIVVVR